MFDCLNAGSPESFRIKQYYSKKHECPQCHNIDFLNSSTDLCPICSEIFFDYLYYCIDNNKQIDIKNETNYFSLEFIAEYLSRASLTEAIAWIFWILFFLYHLSIKLLEIIISFMI